MLETAMLALVKGLTLPLILGEEINSIFISRRLLDYLRRRLGPI
jgi:hypothetical protein